MSASGPHGRASAGASELPEGAGAAPRGRGTRERILEVAEQAFAREGYAGAHLQAIAEAVGVQKTALYYYYPSKVALYEAVLLRILETLDLTVVDALDRDEPHAERLERLVVAMNDLLAERPSASGILVRIWVDRVPMDGTRLRPAIERPVGRFLIFLREGVDAGVFIHVSVRNLLQTLFGALLFHYASDDFGAQILGVEDIFSPQAVAWRRRELRRLVRQGLLRERRSEAEG